MIVKQVFGDHVNKNMPHNSGWNRAGLKFAEKAISIFSFLINDFKFTCTIKNLNQVRFESDLVFIDIFHEERSCQIDINIGKTGYESEGFSLPILIGLKESDKEKKYKRLMASTPKLVESELKTLKELLVEFGGEVLGGKVEIFSDLKRRFDAKQKEFAQEVDAQYIKPKADEAFRERDFQKAIKLYEKIFDELSDVEIKKLEYAKKHLKE